MGNTTRKQSAAAMINAIVAGDSTAQQRVIAVFDAYGPSLNDIKKALFKAGKFPANDKGEPMGNTAARQYPDGKKFNTFSVIARRYVDVKLGRALTEAEKDAKKAAAKTARDGDKAAQAIEDRKHEQAQVKQQKASIASAKAKALTEESCIAYLAKLAEGNEDALQALDQLKTALANPVK